MNFEEFGIQKDVFQTITGYVDEVKEMISSELWENVFLECSKNEILIFWLLYRKEEVNMSEIAEYVHVPLNTATGLVGRLEKRGLIERSRSEEDKRVVLIRFSNKGLKQFKLLAAEMIRYGTRIFSELTDEEIALFFRMTEKVKTVLKEDKSKKEEAKKIRKITIE